MSRTDIPPPKVHPLASNNPFLHLINLLSLLRKNRKEKEGEETKMEKTSPQEQKKLSEMRNHVIWDCGSSLYDSFELRAFEKQLDSAIASRTLSMPHLSDNNQRSLTPSKKKPMSKIFRSFQRLTRAVFRPKLNRNDAISPKDGFYNDNSSSLSTATEFDGLSPRKTASERFTFAAGISRRRSCIFIY